MAAWSAAGLRSRGGDLWPLLVFLLGIGASPGCSSAPACSAPLDRLGCKPTFEQQIAYGLAVSPSPCPLAGPCGAHLVWRTAPDLGSLTCVYDDSGQQLLSAANCTDVPLTCGDFCMRGGQSLHVENDCDPRALPSTCPNVDGGT